jgi:dimethylhistidine N-methyltransferase
MQEPSASSRSAPRFHQLVQHDAGALQDELIEGLLASQAWVSPKFLYDSLGSHLFTAITQLPEYYPTRVEAGILRDQAARIAVRAGQVDTLIDLGAADCMKGEALFPVVQPQCYVPVDISTDFLEAAVGRLHAAYPDLDIVAVGQDFSRSLSLPDDVPTGSRLFFYPGSSIGNWAPDEALQMLRRIRDECRRQGDALLIGVDCMKSAEALLPAYDDALQVTAAFNRNLLLNVNRLLRTDFDVRDWRHQARLNLHESRIEMHLQACRDVTVSWPGHERLFARGETIHTENSYKYRPTDFSDMLAAAGFPDIEHWTDAEGWFSVFHARA